MKIIKSQLIFDHKTTQKALGIMISIPSSLLTANTTSIMVEIDKNRGWQLVDKNQRFVADLVAYYLFEKSKYNFCQRIYHGIYREYSLVVFKGRKNAREIR